jgi:hypothetical protein
VSQVFFLDLAPDGDGMVNVALVNRRLSLGAYIRYRQRELPRFTEWKMMGWGDYVLGLEPGNCWPSGGRAAAREQGTLEFLEPGQSVEYSLEIGVLTGEDALLSPGFTQGNRE